MRNKFKVNNLNKYNFDLFGILDKFNLEGPAYQVKLVGTLFTSPDNHFYKLQSGKTIYYLYEVDYVSDLNYEIENIEKALGFDIELLTVKIPHESYKNSIAKYITDYSGSKPFYHKFLIRKALRMHSNEKANH